MADNVEKEMVKKKKAEEIVEEDGERRSRDKGREGERERVAEQVSPVCVFEPSSARGAESLTELAPNFPCFHHSCCSPVGAPLLHQTAAAACTKRGLAPATADLHQSSNNFGQN